jgi:hypothetical protein
MMLNNNFKIYGTLKLSVEHFQIMLVRNFADQYGPL